MLSECGFEFFNSMMSKYHLSRLLVLLLMIVLCMGIIFYKLDCTRKLPFFDPKNGENFYWTENAFHFRHAQMIAEGKGIPPLDLGIQYPEGLDTSRYITPVMERVSGTLYRFFFSRVPLHIFLCYFSSIFSTLSVLAVFLAGKFLWRSNWAGFMSACFYCLAPASFVRTAGGFIREDFALPFIFFSFACFVYCLRKDRPFVAIVGSLLLVVALAAWHVTQFYLFLFIVGFVVIFFLEKTVNLPRLSFTIFTIIMVVAAIMLPVLRAKWFVFSPQLMLGYGLLIVMWLLPHLGATDRIKRIFWGGSIILVFLLGGLIVQKYSASYSHVYNLILSKLRYFGRLPQDVTRLPFETRVMWSPPFFCPTVKQVFFLLSCSLPLGVVALFQLIGRILKRKAREQEIMIVYFALCAFLLFLMIHRLNVFAVFFFALPIGFLVSTETIKRKSFLIYILLGMCLVFELFKLGFFQLRQSRPTQEYINDLTHFIKSNCSEDEVVLTSFELGPVVAAYGHRPVILHSKFESKTLRDKVREVYTSLYRSEEDFYQVCKRYKANVFVYQSDMVLKDTPGSIRYAAGAIPLKRDCAVFLFHFAPQNLKYFHLIHQNFRYRIFQIGKKASKMTGRVLQYEPCYDLSVFCDTETLCDVINDSMIASGFESLRRPETHKMLGDRFLSSGDPQTAVLEYERALTIDPKHAGAAWGIGKAMCQIGEWKKGLIALRLALQLEPTLDVTCFNIPNATIWVALGDDEIAKGRYVRAEKLFRRAIRLEPVSSMAHLGLGIALFGQNRAKEAEELLHQVISYDPQCYRAYEVLGKLYTTAGDYGRAIEAVEMSLSLNSNQPHLVEILKILYNQ